MNNYYEEEHFMDTSEFNDDEKDSVIVGSDAILDLNLLPNEVYRTTGNIVTNGFVSLKELLVKISEAILIQIREGQADYAKAYSWIIESIRLERATV